MAGLRGPATFPFSWTPFQETCRRVRSGFRTGLRVLRPLSSDPYDTQTECWTDASYVTTAEDHMVAASHPSVTEAPRRTTPTDAGASSRRNPLLIAGGLCGVVGTLVYGSTQALPAFDGLHDFPLETSLQTKALLFWVPAIFPVLAMMALYALYRLLQGNRATHAAFLGFVSGVIGFSILTMHNLVQSTVHMEASDLARSDATFSPDVWNSIVSAVHGVDNGMDLAWDLFYVLSMVFFGVAMMGHRRFRWWWGVPAILMAGLLLLPNAATIPEPPASAGLFDPGPLSGLYWLALSAYLVKMGLEPGSELATAAPGGTAAGAADSQ